MLLSLLLLLAAPPWQVTYALQRPLTERDEATLAARLPAWQESYGFDRYALPIATPTAGGDLAWQMEAAGRVAAAVGPERLVLATPPVGTVGWETSNNVGYIPLGGRPALVATATELWLAALTAVPAHTLALMLEGWRSEPTAAQLGAHLDQFLAAAEQAGRAAELWLSAELLLMDPQAEWLAALTPARLERVARLVLLGTALAHDPAPTKDEAPPATPGEAIVEPSGLTRQKRAARVLAAAARLLPAERLGADLTDHPRSELLNAAAAQDYLAGLRAAQLGAVLVRGRLDTPQDPLWREILKALRD